MYLIKKNSSRPFGVTVEIACTEQSRIAMVNEIDTLDTIAGVVTAIGVSLLILGKGNF